MAHIAGRLSCPFRALKINGTLTQGVALGAFSLAPTGQPKVVKAAAQPLKPLLGCQSYSLPILTDGEYINLVDYTGRQVYPGKRGTLKGVRAQSTR